MKHKQLKWWGKITCRNMFIFYRPTHQRHSTKIISLYNLVSSKMCIVYIICHRLKFTQTNFIALFFCINYSGDNYNSHIVHVDISFLNHCEWSLNQFPSYNNEYIQKHIMCMSFLYII